MGLCGSARGHTYLCYSNIHEFHNLIMQKFISLISFIYYVVNFLEMIWACSSSSSNADIISSSWDAGKLGFLGFLKIWTRGMFMITWKAWWLATGYICLMLLINTEQYSTMINPEMRRTMMVGCFSAGQCNKLVITSQLFKLCYQT